MKILQDIPVYTNIVTTLQNLPVPNLQGVIASLQEEERKVKNASIGDFYTQALATQHGKQYQESKLSQSKGKTNMKCSICSRTNHMDKDCYYKNKYKAYLVEEDKDAETIANVSANVLAYDIYTF